MRAAAAAAVLVLLLCLAGSAASAPRFRAGNPYWIAGGRLIGFSGGYDADPEFWEGYVANSDGSARRRTGGLVVSPSGRLTASMVFPPQVDCVVDIQRLDGGRPRTFRIRDGGCWAGPVWSPDESAVLAEVHTNRDERVAIYLVDRRRGPRLLSPASRKEESPTWSPDASRIVFTSCPAEPRRPPFFCQIVIANRDGHRRRAIVRNIEYGTGYFVPAPVWSPDGRSVAYATPYGEEPDSRTTPPPRRWGIYVVRVDGTGLRRLAVTPYLVANPAVAWSANSRSLAFRDSRGIWTVRADGGRLHRHTTRSDDYSPLSWAPGHSILFVQDDAIYRIRPGGKVWRLLP